MMVTGGVIVAITGAATHGARVTVGPQMFAAMGGPPPGFDPSMWIGSTMTVAGGIMAAFGAVAKVYLDNADKLAKQKMENDKADLEARLKAKDAESEAVIKAIRAKSAAELELFRAEAETRIAVAKREAFEEAEIHAREVVALSNELAQVTAGVGELKSLLAETHKIVEHTDRGVSQVKTTSKDLLMTTAERVLENSEKIAGIEAAIRPLSGDDIPVTQPPLVVE